MTMTDMNKIKRLETPNYFDKTTHYFAETYARSKEHAKFIFVKEYMYQKMKFKAEVKYDSERNISFVELDQIDGDYTDIIILKGNPNVEEMKDWFINKW